MNPFQKTLSILSLFILLLSCNNPKQTSMKQTDALPHQLEKKLTDIIVVDIFSPPVATRIYANTSLALYEAIRFQQADSKSITAKLKGFEPMPVPEEGKQYDFSIAAIQSFCETAKKVIFYTTMTSMFCDDGLNSQHIYRFHIKKSEKMRNRDILCGAKSPKGKTNTHSRK
jgi:hypothetical protein